jgi:hypothetical protein
MLSLSGENYPRYPIQKIVSYEYEGESVLTLTLDLGEGGMKIETQRPLPMDACMRFKLFLGANSIWLETRIVNIQLTPDRQAISDIHFTELSRKDHHLLRTYLATLGH